MDIRTSERVIQKKDKKDFMPVEEKQRAEQLGILESRRDFLEFALERKKCLI
jgi:hypothetical protein